MQLSSARVWRLLVWAFALYGFTFALVLHTPVADWMVRPLAVWPAIERGNAIVVLSAWATPNQILNDSGVWRTLEAARLYRLRLAPVILISGGGDASGAMAQMLREVGVPPQAIELDPDAYDTHESAVNVARLTKTRGWDRVLLVTDAKHMRRAVGAFVHEGVRVSPAPAMMWELWWDQPYDRYRKLHGVVHEYVGIVYYWSRGWI